MPPALVLERAGGVLELTIELAPRGERALASVVAIDELRGGAVGGERRRDPARGLLASRCTSE